MNCLRNLVGLSGALQMYMTDYDGELPGPEGAWNDAIREYRVGLLLRCPDVQDPGHSYALNLAVVKSDTRRIPKPEEVPMIFESDKGPNAVGGREALVTPARHLGWHNFGFVDGHAQAIRESEVSRLRWAP